MPCNFQQHNLPWQLWQNTSWGFPLYFWIYVIYKVLWNRWAVSSVKPHFCLFKENHFFTQLPGWSGCTFFWKFCSRQWTSQIYWGFFLRSHFISLSGSGESSTSGSQPGLLRLPKGSLHRALGGDDKLKTKKVKNKGYLPWTGFWSYLKSGKVRGKKTC